MLPLTIIYVNAGTQLAQLDSPRDILPPGLLGSLIVAVLFPLLARRPVKVAQGRGFKRL